LIKETFLTDNQRNNLFIFSKHTTHDHSLLARKFLSLSKTSNST
jgi:hypothetical protein